jgi:hypothetical protein
MIGHTLVSDKDGKPLDEKGNMLSESTYNPPEEIKKLFAKVQTDYQTAWRLQHRPFKAFDDLSLLDRAERDQETFGAYVPAEVVPQHKQWRWKGRKNTSRNKIMGILAHVIAGMLFPTCYAYNDENEEDAMSAKVMRILVEDHLKRAKYETKFLYMMLTALVNPAVIVEVEYVEALQTIKAKLADGTYKVKQAVDELLSGLNLNIIPIDQFLIADFFTGDVQRQPFNCRVRRISWDEARSVYKDKHFIDGVDQFDFVQAGKTRVFLAGNEQATLYDIEWTEADANYVQEMTMYYRPEDLEVTFVGGVFMGETNDVYNSNPFKHRRLVNLDGEWATIPIYPFAKAYFEPLDPTGRFFYGKSAAFKEFWDDAAQNKMHQLAFDGTYLDVIKPMFVSGVAKIDGTVIVPGATIGLPQGASVTPYQLGPNLVAAMNMMNVETQDMSESTQDKIMSGVAEAGVTAYATSKAEQNAKVFLGNFGIMISTLVSDIGMLTIDNIIANTTVGDLEEQIPGVIKAKYKTHVSKGKESGRDVTNKIEFNGEMVGQTMTKDKVNELEWKMFEDAGGLDSKQRNFMVNPYKFARHKFNLYVDPSQIISRSMGTDEIRKERAFNLMADPRVAPYVDMQAVVQKFILEDFSDGDPDEFKAKPQQAQPGMPQGMPGGMQGMSAGLPSGMQGQQLPTNQ